MTILARLLASEEDSQGYITYVFECLDEDMINETKYIMCTRFPNWDHKDISLGEVGYLKFFEVEAGIDKWFDGKNMVPYRYDGCHFIKFVKKPEKVDHKYRM